MGLGFELGVRGKELGIRVLGLGLEIELRVKG